MILRFFYKRKLANSYFFLFFYAMFVVVIWYYSGRLKTISIWRSSVPYGICFHFIVRQDGPNWHINMKNHKVMTVSLQQRNCCHWKGYQKSTHKSRQRVHLGNFFRRVSLFSHHTTCCTGDKVYAMFGDIEIPCFNAYVSAHASRNIRPRSHSTIYSQQRTSLKWADHFRFPWRYTERHFHLLQISYKL